MNAKDTKDLIANIEARIAENGLFATYSKVNVTEVQADSPMVGIWWWFSSGKIIKVENKAENCEQEEMICVPQEHFRVFPFVQKKYAEEIPEILHLKYNQIERGRIWALIDADKPGKITYMLTCSTAMTKNTEALAAIKASFGLEKLHVKVQNHGCMYDGWEIKL